MTGRIQLVRNSLNERPPTQKEIYDYTKKELTLVARETRARWNSFADVIGPNGSVPVVYRPEDFGAEADGVTDDTDAINACFEAVRETGGTIYFKQSATYLCNTLTFGNAILNFDMSTSNKTVHIEGNACSIETDLGGTTETGTYPFTILDNPVLMWCNQWGGHWTIRNIQLKLRALVTSVSTASNKICTLLYMTDSDFGWMDLVTTASDCGLHGTPAARERNRVRGLVYENLLALVPPRGPIYVTNHNHTNLGQNGYDAGDAIGFMIRGVGSNPQNFCVSGSGNIEECFYNKMYVNCALVDDFTPSQISGGHKANFFLSNVQASKFRGVVVQQENVMQGNADGCERYTITNVSNTTPQIVTLAETIDLNWAQPGVSGPRRSVTIIGTSGVADGANQTVEWVAGNQFRIVGSAAAGVATQGYLYLGAKFVIMENGASACLGVDVHMSQSNNGGPTPTYLADSVMIAPSRNNWWGDPVAGMNFGPLFMDVNSVFSTNLQVNGTTYFIGRSRLGEALWIGPNGLILGPGGSNTTAVLQDGYQQFFGDTKTLQAGGTEQSVNGNFCGPKVSTSGAAGTTLLTYDIPVSTAATFIAHITAYCNTTAGAGTEGDFYGATRLVRIERIGSAGATAISVAAIGTDDNTHLYGGVSLVAADYAAGNGLIVTGSGAALTELTWNVTISYHLNSQP